MLGAQRPAALSKSLLPLVEQFCGVVASLLENSLQSHRYSRLVEYQQSAHRMSRLINDERRLDEVASAALSEAVLEREIQRTDAGR
ncbi:MAG: hypothetical protein HC915_15880, partial [Anaerolineae bacterium]|nr:hypothetical protein [Anaerolineae bacterium]